MPALYPKPNNQENHLILKILIQFLLLWSFSQSVSALTFVEAKINGVAGVEGLTGANAIAVSADGQNVYATGYLDNAIVTFARDTGSGKLTFVQAIRDSDINHQGLKNVNALALSPDGKHLYATSPIDHSVVVFTRNLLAGADNGKLTLVEIQKNGINNVDGLNGANAVAVSPDGLQVYVLGRQDSALTVFNRDTFTGVLTQPHTVRNGVNGVSGLQGAMSVVVAQPVLTEATRHIYVVSSIENAVSIFTQTATIPLTYSTSYRDGTDNITGLIGAYSIALSADNKTIYVASNGASALVAFNRNLTTGTLTYLTTYRDNTTIDATTTIDGLAGVRSVTVSPDGTMVYATGSSDNAIALFKRDTASGLLTFDSVIRNGSDNANALSGVTAVTTSSDNKNVYTTALSSNAIAVFSSVAQDLALAGKDNSPVLTGSTLIHTLTVTNQSTTQATGVTVQETLPTGVTFVPATSSPSCNADAAMVTCKIGIIEANATASVAIAMTTPQTAGEGTATATVISDQPDGNSANDTVNIKSQWVATLPSADLELTVTTPFDTVGVSKPLTYTLTVKNLSPTDVAANTVLTAVLPAGLTDVKLSDPACSYEATTQTVTCQLGNRGATTSQEVTIEATTPATPPVAPLKLTAQVQATVLDPNPDNNTATKEINVSIIQIDLKVIDAVANPNSVRVGDSITYTIKVSNNTANAVEGATLTTTLPPQVAFQKGAEGCTANGSVVTCQLGTFAGNTTIEKTIEVMALQAGQPLGDPNIVPVSTTFTVGGQGTEATPADNSLTANVIITGAATDVVVTVKDEGSAVLVNMPVTYTITVTNNGPGETEVTLNNVLTGNNVIIDKVTISGGTCSSGTTFNCSLETLTAGQSSTVTVVAIPTAVGTLKLTTEAIVAAYDPSLPNIASQETAVADTQADLAVTLTSAPNPALLGGEFDYILTVQNKGPGDASGVLLTQILPNSVTLIETKPSQGEACLVEDRKITCAVGPIVKDATATVLVTVKPTILETLTSQLEARSNQFDIDKTNNNATATTTVTQSSADIGLVVVDSPDPVVVDNLITYQITISNEGPDTASGIALITTWPTSLVYVAYLSEPSVTCQSSGSGVTCNFNQLLKGAQTQITLTAQVTAMGEVNTLFNLQSQEFDPDATNNTATVTTRVNHPDFLFFIEALKNNISGIQGLGQVNALTLSSEGRYLYAVGFGSHSLVVFRRTEEGRLEFIEAWFDGVNEVDGLASASNLALNGDESRLYVVGNSDNALAVFNRDRSTGKLTFVKVYKDDTDGIDGLGGAYAVTVYEQSVYVASLGDDAIAIFNEVDGELVFAEAIKHESLDGVNSLAIVPQGQQVLATSTKSLLVFSRSAENGHLTLLQRLQDGADGNLSAPTGIAVAGQNVYVASGGLDNAVTIWTRQPESGLLTLAETVKNGVNGVEGLNGVFALAVNGDYLYTVASNDNSVTVFKRAEPLTQIDVLRDGIEGVDGLAGARAVAVSPNGHHIYVAGFLDSAIALFRLSSSDLSLSGRVNVDPVNVGQPLLYTLTLTNNGPDRATHVTLINTLPTTAEVTTIKPEQGQCTVEVEKVLCELGTLNVDQNLTIQLEVKPLQMGELSLVATAKSDQFDPTSPTQVTVKTQVVATADIAVSLLTTPLPAGVESPLQFAITVANQGPDLANKVVVTFPLPEHTTFVEGTSTACSVTVTDNIAQCTLTDLPAGQSGVINVTVIPQLIGTLTGEISAATTAFDATVANNKATYQIEVAARIIDDTVNNQGQLLRNYLVKPTGAIIGGAVAGTIENQGLISGVEIRPDTIVKGGKLSGVITNRGLIENAQLLSGTVINGGTVRGKIFGFPEAPATINANIVAGTELQDVIIGVNSEVSPKAILGPGVRFMANSTIPAGIDLTGALPLIYEPISQTLVPNLNYDVVIGGSSILQAINTLPELVQKGQVFIQNAITGNLILSLQAEQQVFAPWIVYQTTSEPAGSSSTMMGETIIVTANGRVIVGQPGVESPEALQSALTSFLSYQAFPDGNLTVGATDQGYFKARPTAVVQPTDPFLPVGLDAATHHYGSLSVTVYGLRFVDESGVRREQWLYPASAHLVELQKALKGIPGASTVDFSNDGSVVVKIRQRSYTAVFDYRVTKGAVSNVTQLLIVPDQNGDSQEDVKIVYVNGDQQIAFLVPLPPLAAEVQTIPAVENADITVHQADADHLWLYQGNAKILLKITARNQLDENTPPQMFTEADGTMIFVTATGLQLVTEPQVQNLAELPAALQGLGWELTEVKSNGDLVVRASSILRFSARPDVESTVAKLILPLGLNSVPAPLPGVPSVLWIFRDETGIKRQQFIYPTAKDPQGLQNFLKSIPGVESVTLWNEGIVEVVSGGQTVKGLLAYEVVMGDELSTGGIQFFSIPDANGDDLDDFKVIYGNGESQVIYRMPLN